MKNRIFGALLAGSAAFALLAAVPVQQGGLADHFAGASSALAQQGGGNGKGGDGSGNGGSGNGGHNGAGAGGDRGGGNATAGQRGSGTGAGGGQGGGKPAWAQEGIPEVELGRLSVARSPAKVLDRALTEVLSTWDPSLGTLYSMSAEDFAEYVSANWDSVTIIDSPLQNLALMQALIDGNLDLAALNIHPDSLVDLAAIFLGVASDKTIPITSDTVKAIDVIMDLNLDSWQIEEIAEKAEDVRVAVLEGHG